MENYRELLLSVESTKKTYDSAKRTLSENVGRAQGVLETIQSSIQTTKDTIERNEKGYAILTKSAKLIEDYSSSIMGSLYKGLEKMLSDNLAKMGGNRVVIEERATKAGKSVLDIYVMEPGGDGKKEEKRDIKSDCGHGVGQLVSLFLTCSLVENSAKSKVVLLDEVVSGVSSSNLYVVNKVIEYMHNNGFIVVVNEHGFIPGNSTVYTLENRNGVSKCVAVEHNEAPIYRELGVAAQ